MIFKSIKYTTSDQRKNMTKRLRVAYKHYFGCEIGDQTKSWARHPCCTVCYSGLTQWLNGKLNRMPFAVPMIWREQKDHLSDCYFCITNISGYCKKNKSEIVYPDCQSALKPVAHDTDYPVPIPPSSDAERNRRCAQAETKKLYTLLNQAIVNLSVTKSPRLMSM